MLKPFFRFYSTVLVVLLAVLVVPASSRADTEQEISHLLNHIESSGCIFIRNGKEHKANKAREHIEYKYGRVKRKVKTTEDFIKYAATKSSLSGKPYKVLADGREIACAAWLQAELDRFRNK